MDGMEEDPTQAEFLAKAGMKNCNFVNIATLRDCKKFKTTRRIMVDRTHTERGMRNLCHAVSILRIAGCVDFAEAVAPNFDRLHGSIGINVA